MNHLRRIALLGALSALLGCATMYRLNAETYPLSGNPLMPAAAGSVDMKAGANDNTQLHVNVKHLAAPDKIESGATTFVVWIKPLDTGPQNIGALTVDEELNGDLYTVTSQREFDLMITPERSPTTQYPSGPVVLRTAISRR